MTDFAKAQRRLQTAGYDVGPIDGIAGMKTWAGIFAYTAQRPMGLLLPLGQGAATFLHQYAIDQTSARVCNFVGQAAHESDRFRYMREIWGPTAAQLGYEGRADLGNCKPGDGRLYCGRGIFGLTGRGNYRAVGEAIGVDLEGNPTCVESPAIAVQTAAFFWFSHGLNVLADAGAEDEITHAINGGENGIANRRQFVARAKGLFV